MEPSDSLNARAVAALDDLRALLGPGAVPAEGSDNGDPGIVEELVDVGLTELRGILPNYTGPEAARLAVVALELADVQSLLAGERTRRRVEGVVQVQRALARLRAVGSTEQMLMKAPEAVCEYCGFERALLWRIEARVVTPLAAYSARDPAWGGKVLHHFSSVHGPIMLDSLMLENEMLRRRAPLIVHDALNSPGAMGDLLRRSNIRSYVAAPVMPEGRVIGGIHASTMARDTVADRDVLWAFAEGYGYALERTILLERLHDQGERIRQLVASTESVLTEIREAGLQITNTSKGLLATEAEPVRSAMLSAPVSPIHQILTGRELEIIELLAHGETNKQIAERMVVSEGTVKSHVGNILRKLQAANRAEAVSKFMRLTGPGTA